MAYASALFKSLAAKQVIAPYVQSVMMQDTWPESIRRPSDPYYHDSHTDDYFHPSTHALYGERALYEMLHPERRKQLEPKGKTFEDVMTPLMGSMMHSILQQKLVLAGLVGPEDIEIPLIDEDRHWKGHADLLSPVETLPTSRPRIRDRSTGYISHTIPGYTRCTPYAD